jgi:hypothetical protein
MNDNYRFCGRVGLWATIVLSGMLTGCTTYVEAPRPSPSYVAPPPAEVREVVVTPPPPPPVEAETVVEIRNERDFYEPLRPYGHWVDVPDYGRCWVPERVDRDWRPYTNGHWQHTEAGWYWVSDEPWGWATYHYGRWDWRPEFGWLWVPQTQWAPAWVEFHQGGGYLGWAPLHPSARIRGGDLDAPVRPDRERGLVFVEERHFLEPVRPATVVVNNTTIINQTVNITSVHVVNNTIINEGPRTTVIEKASGRSIEAVPARELRRKQEAPVVAVRARPVNDSRDSKAQPEAERAAKARAEALRKARETEAMTAQEAARRTEAARSQAQVEAQRKAKEAESKVAQAEEQRRLRAADALAQAEAQRKVKETAAMTAQEEAARRAEAVRSQAQVEAQRRAREAELRTAQVEEQRRARASNALAQAEAQRKARETAAMTAQEEAARRAETANTQAQLEAQRRAKEAELKTARTEGQRTAKETELKTAQAEAERRNNEAKTRALAGSQKPEVARGEDAITSRIVAVFAEDPALRGVHVVRTNGLVHLNGSVPSAEEKKRAGELAQKIETAHPVRNNLTVRP